MLLIAHRGFRDSKGENRMVDFEIALKYCRAVEFDIRLTKDNKIIIFHDEDFKRIANYEAKVKDLTYEAITKIPFFEKNRDYLPPLFLDDYANKIAKHYDLINVEIKPGRYTAFQYQIIKDGLTALSLKTKAKIVVSSFSPRVLEWIASLNETFYKGYLIEKPSHLNWSLVKKFDYVHPYVGTLKRKKNVELFKKINLPMNIWTLQKEKDVARIKALYPEHLLHGFISDKNDLTLT